MTRLAGLASIALLAASFANATAPQTQTARSNLPARQVLVSNASYSLRDVKAKARAMRRARRSNMKSRSCPVEPVPENPEPQPTPPDQVPVPAPEQPFPEPVPEPQEPIPEPQPAPEPEPEPVPAPPVDPAPIPEPEPPAPESPAPEPEPVPEPEPAPPADPAPPPPTFSANKRGVAADWSSPKGVVQNLRGPKFYAHYNWSPYRFDDLPSDVDFWPMLHGEHTLQNNEWAHVTAGYATTAMGLNEVNQVGQSIMGVGRGIEIWRNHLSPLKGQGYRLVSHSTNQAEDGFQWHNDFRSQCPECESEIDIYSVHWYGTDAQAFKDYMVRFHDTFGKPLVVTEFAYTDWVSQPNPDDVKNFMTDTMHWMDEQDFIQGYMWFGSFPADRMPGGVPAADSLVNGDGTPNDLGNHYMNA